MTGAPSSRSEVRRIAERGRYDRSTIDAILDDALVCHVAWSGSDGPTCLPMLHVRIDDRLYVHGSPASRLARAAKQGVDVCVVVTLIDGLVLARSAFHHSVNYRSVVIHGRLEAVVDADEKQRVFDALVEHVVPGRGAGCRPVNARENKATAVLGIDLTEAAAKVRSGPPKDDDEDMVLDHWAGVVPLETRRGTPIPDPDLRAGIDLPDHLRS